jgi:hypothetical protein
MTSERATPPSEPTRLDLPPQVLPAMALLLDAHVCASDVQQSPWDFAVPWHDLRNAGLTAARLRWLACRRLVEVASPVARRGRRRQAFRPGVPAQLGDRVAVVLTPAGVATVRAARAAGVESAPTLEVFPRPNGKRSAPRLVPRWDEGSLTLWLGDRLLKQFRQAAPDQARLLTTFQEQRWRRRIDDPLPPRHGVLSAQRLGDTVHNLNRGLRDTPLRFRVADGGRALWWALQPGRPPMAPPRKDWRKERKSREVKGSSGTRAGRPPGRTATAARRAVSAPPSASAGAPAPAR